MLEVAIAEAFLVIGVLLAVGGMQGVKVVCRIPQVAVDIQNSDPHSQQVVEGLKEADKRSKEIAATVGLAADKQWGKSGIKVKLPNAYRGRQLDCGSSY